MILEELGCIVDTVDSMLYGRVLIALLLICGIVFTIMTRGVQFRLFHEVFRILREGKSGSHGVTSFQALMVTTASRVGTGNIVGVSTALCLGGFGAVPWMWAIACLGMASAFAETVLAQIFKKRSPWGSYGGPAYYIEHVTGGRTVSLIFIGCLISTFMVGFNMLASYNLQDSFSGFDFYDRETTPFWIGVVLTVLVVFVLLGGGRRIVSFTTFLVPFMGVFYIAVAGIAVLLHWDFLPDMFARMFREALDFEAAFGGFAGSCIMYGIKRALFSNEAGMGSSPNAAASADVSHPVKQGLVQVFSVFLDTMIVCTATAVMCLSSGIEPTAELNGVPYVLAVVEESFGGWGRIIVAVTITLFAFTTIIGNLFYVDRAFLYVFGRTPGAGFLLGYRLTAAAVVMAGAVLPSALLWNIADLTMGSMTIINVICILLLSGYVRRALKDYQEQRRRGQDPRFLADSIGLQCRTDYWQSGNGQD